MEEFYSREVADCLFEVPSSESKIMDYFCAFSWPYGDDAEAKANACFDALRANQGKCPFADKPHEICLAKSVRGSVFVGVLVLPGTTGDDSMEIFKKAEEWFEQSRVKDYEDYNHLSVNGRSTDATLGAGYTVLKYFGNLRGASGGGGSAAGTSGCALVAALFGVGIWWITKLILA